MVKITYVTFDGAERTVSVETGMTLMEAAVRHGVDGIDAVCGGNCYCGTCRLYISEGWRDKLAPPGGDELAMIEAAGETDPSARLGCQVPITENMEGIVVQTPRSQT
jgi:2Fe-2S ferredoxin